MSAKYQEFSGLNLPAIEKEILADWTKNEAFEKSVSLREVLCLLFFMRAHPALTECRAFTT